MKKRLNIVIDSCNKCPYQQYFRCDAYRCTHPKVEDVLEDNSTDSREDNYPDWCPLEDDYLKRGRRGNEDILYRARSTD